MTRRGYISLLIQVIPFLWIWIWLHVHGYAEFERVHFGLFLVHRVECVEIRYSILTEIRY